MEDGIDLITLSAALKLAGKQITLATLQTATYKGLLNSSSTLPTEGNNGDYYIFSNAGTIGTVTFTLGDRYMKSDTEWTVIPAEMITVKQYVTDMSNVTFEEIDNGDGTIDIYVNFPEGQEPAIYGTSTATGVDIFVEY